MNAIRLVVCALGCALTATSLVTADGWVTGSTGRGEARWTVDGDKLSYSGGADFGSAVSGPTLADGFVEVRSRPLGGREDQAGGVVWRWQAADTYYMAPAIPVGNTYVAHNMVTGPGSAL